MGRKTNRNADDVSRKGLTRAKRDELNKLVTDLLEKCAVSGASPPSKDWEIHIETCNLLEKIISIEHLLERPTVDRKNAVTPFLEWLSSHGTQMGPVELADIPGFGYSVRAVTPIKKGDLIFSIPHKLLLSIETAKASKIGPFIKNDPILSQMPNVTLALHLLNESYDPKSFWAPYLCALPNSYDTVMYFTADDLKELKGSPVFEESLKMCRNIARQYAYFYSLLQKNKDPTLNSLRANFTYNDYRWAVSTVMTRQNLIPNPTELAPPINALIPLWDFCNHKNGEFSTDFNPDTRETICQANEDYGEREQVFIYYGNRTCAEQFVHNGFVDTDNPRDALVIKVGLSKSDPLAEKRTELMFKLRIIPEENLSGPVPFQLHARPNPVDGKLLSFLRLFCMDKDALDFWLASENTGNLMHEECGIETAVEDKAWSFLKTRCELLLRLYATTKEEDEQLLQEDVKQVNEGIDQRRRMCARLRLAEKRILISAIDYAAQKMRK